MSLKNIEKWSLGYFLLKCYSSIFHYLWYSEYYVKGRKNIPKRTPIIFALNHQNALMDALAVIYSCNRQSVFLARADIFKKHAFAKLLYFLKILPIYRIRDGYKSLQNNDDIFDRTIDALKAGRPLAILPEGTHEAMKILRPLKKGLARIAFNAEEAMHLEKGLMIVPVGLDYNNYYTFRNKLVVTYGQPIPVASYMDTYKNNPAKGMIELTNAVATGMKEIIIHVDEPGHYDTIMSLARLQVIDKSRLAGRDYYHHFLAMKKAVDDLNLFYRQNVNDMSWLTQKTALFDSLLKEMRLNICMLKYKKISLYENMLTSLLLLILFPLYIYGLLLNYFAYKLPVLVTKKIKDIVFHSSVKLVLGLIIYPVWYILLTIIFWLIFKDIFLTIIFLVNLPVTGLFSFHYYNVMKNSLMHWRYYSLLRKKDEKLSKLFDLKEELLNKLSSI